jgi:hypothetical protein
MAVTHFIIQHYKSEKKCYNLKRQNLEDNKKAV